MYYFLIIKNITNLSGKQSEFAYICRKSLFVVKMKKKPIVALIYDFDGTLSPGNMQEFGFIQAIGKTPEEFWKISDGIARGQDASNVLSYMKLMLDEASKSGIKLRRSDFRKFGAHIRLFEGVKEWFRIVNEYGEAHGVKIEHYINSSGLKEIIEGSPIAGAFKHIFACTFLYDENGEAEWPGIAVDYTAKTQFIFKINKGIFSARDNKKVNESVAEDKKRIPFQQMIYFGDGETDIPSMKIVNMFGGNSVAVYNPKFPEKKAFAQKLLRQGRVNFITPAVYSKESRTFRVVCAIIDKIKADWELKQLARYR
jgi:phosphoserine phosphatase